MSPDGQRGATGATGRPSIYLHVGEPKTGTTFLQQVMWRNRSELAVSGVMLPGPRPLAHWRAAQDLREVEQIDNDPVGPFAGSWDRLARQALRAPRVGVISHELLCAASAEQAQRAVASLAPADVHVVLSVRDFATLLPAEWQETVKHRNTRAWEDWLGDVIEHESNSANRRKWWFWRVHDTLEIARLWSQLIPPERVHVVTVPSRGAPQSLLWERFAGLIGVDPRSVDTGRARSNSALGLAEVELLRRVNEALPDEVPGWFYMRKVKDLLAHDALAGRGSSERLELPAERDEWTRQEAARVVDGLRAGGYDIVGDLDELQPRPVTGRRPAPSDVTTEQLLDAAVTAVSAVLVDTAAGQGVPKVASRPGVPAPQPRPRGPVKRALIAAADRSPAAHQARRAYWHSVNTVRRIRAEARDPDHVS